MDLDDRCNAVILVADDGDINRMLIKSMIGKVLADAVVVEASGGAEAVDIWRRRSPDLVFMDLQMPGTDGFEAAANIREIEPDGRHTPIIALTGGTSDNDRERCDEVGIDDYASKPVPLDAFRKLLVKWLPNPMGEPAIKPGYRSVRNGDDDFPISLAYLRGQGHDEETIEEMFTLFLQRGPELLDELDRGVTSHEYRDAMKAAHSLKGILRSIGVSGPADAAERIERHVESRASSTISDVAVLRRWMDSFLRRCGAHFGI